MCYVSYLTPNNKCALPTTKVDRCLNYSSLDRCYTCQFNYHLVNNVCTTNTIDRCVK